MLEEFLRISENDIVRDIEHARNNLTSIVNEIQALKNQSQQISAVLEARLAHLNLILAHEISCQEILPTEALVFYAAFAAGEISQHAEMVAASKDTCAVLSEQIDAIRHREGLASDEFWLLNEGPSDYRDLEEKFSLVLGGVSDTVFSFVLRRYRLKKAAELFENDSESFEIQREIGRRVMIPTSKDDAVYESMLDKHFEKKYGPEALRKIHRRVEELMRQKYS